MHQIRFCWGAYSAPPDPLDGFKGVLLLKEGQGRRGRVREGTEGKGEGGEMEEEALDPPLPPDSGVAKGGGQWGQLPSPP